MLKVALGEALDVADVVVVHVRDDDVVDALRTDVHPPEEFEGIRVLEPVLRRRPLAVESAIDQNGPRVGAHQPEVVVDAQVFIGRGSVGRVPEEFLCLPRCPRRVPQGVDVGGADVLVNNAGVMLLGPFSSEQRDDYRQMIEVNLLGAITATEAASP